MISDYVIPHSAKKLNVPEKDGLTIWYALGYSGKSTFLLRNRRRKKTVKTRKRKMIAREI